MTHRPRLKRQPSRCATAIKKDIDRLRARLGEWWRWHWTRVADEHGYAEALTAVLLEAIALLTRSTRLRHAAHELLAVYVAVLRTLRRPGHAPA